MSPKYKLVKRYYDNGMWPLRYVYNAVEKGWITDIGRPIWNTLHATFMKTISDVPVETPAGWNKVLTIVSTNGLRVNVRKGNNIKYGRVALLNNGTELEWIATAENGWHAAVYGDQIIWVSDEFSVVS